MIFGRNYVKRWRKTRRLSGSPGIRWERRWHRYTQGAAWGNPELPDPVALYTYGSPRVGTGRFINHVKIDHERWVNNNDIVARVPPPWFGYRHSGQEKYIDSQGQICEKRGFARFKDRAAGFWKGLFKGRIDPFMDHLMPDYILAIQGALRSEEK